MQGRLLALTMQEVAECRAQADLFELEMSGGVVLELFLFAQSLVGVAVVADSHLSVALETLCARWQIPEDVAGASFLALGGAAPEIFINVVGTIRYALAKKQGNAHSASVAAKERTASQGQALAARLAAAHRVRVRQARRPHGG